MLAVRLADSVPALIFGFPRARSPTAPGANYFDPAYGAVLPALAGRESVQAANALVRAGADALWLGGSAIAAALLPSSR